MAFKLPFPSFVPYAYSWNFWSFHLTSITSTSGSGFFAEVIFGWPSIWVTRGKPPKTLAPTPAVTQNIPGMSLNNADLVGISCGKANSWECTGSNLLVGPQNIPYSLDQARSGEVGTTGVQVANGVATLTGLGIILDPSQTVGEAVVLTSDNQGNGQTMYGGYTSAGKWAFKTSWAQWVGPAPLGAVLDEYSLSNPVFSAPAFPPGSEFPH